MSRWSGLHWIALGSQFWLQKTFYAYCFWVWASWMSQAKPTSQSEPERAMTHTGSHWLALAREPWIEISSHKPRLLEPAHWLAHTTGSGWIACFMNNFLTLDSQIESWLTGLRWITFYELPLLLLFIPLNVPAGAPWAYKTPTCSRSTWTAECARSRTSVGSWRPGRG